MMRVLAALLALFVGLAGCQKSREGTRCVEGATECTSPTSALVCVHTVFKKTACRGAKGCAGECDESVAEAGEPCFTAKTPFACNVARDTLLACENGKFALSKRCACVVGANGAAACSDAH